ncbi:MAG: rRNA maturation RNase YbeY [Acidimicrobiia bacterium]
MTVLVSDEHPSSGVDPDHIRRSARAVLDAEGYPPDAEVSIVLVDDAEMAGWNARALGNNGPTDVLSFPLEPLQAGVTPLPKPGGPPLLVGDVVIAPDYVRRQAHVLGVAAEDELALMVTHGVLHLLGYDHQADEDADLMEARERAILESQGRRRR